MRLCLALMALQGQRALDTTRKAAGPSGQDKGPFVLSLPASRPGLRWRNELRGCALPQPSVGQAPGSRTMAITLSPAPAAFLSQPRAWQGGGGGCWALEPCIKAQDHPGLPASLSLPGVPPKVPAPIPARPAGAGGAGLRGSALGPEAGSPPLWVVELGRPRGGLEWRKGAKE